jgi:NAD(P)-dependent dehydrogenase (short-subunit alcohol dehydrogenase family)
MTSASSFWSDIKDKVVVIVGATAGIGAGVATYFASKGARVVVSGRRADKGTALAARIGANATFIQCDTTDAAQVSALFEQVKIKFGHVDLLLANAGVFIAGDSVGGVSMENLQRQLDVNVKGPILAVKTCLPLLAADGVIVVTSSAISVKAVPSLIGYTISKAAIDSYVRCAAEELKSSSRRIYSVNPEVFDSEMSASWGLDRTSLAGLNPSGVLGDPIKIAHLIEELACGRVQQYANGANIAIDGDGTHFPVAEVLTRPKKH